MLEVVAPGTNRRIIDDITRGIPSLFEADELDGVDAATARAVLNSLRLWGPDHTQRVSELLLGSVASWVTTDGSISAAVTSTPDDGVLHERASVQFKARSSERSSALAPFDRGQYQRFLDTLAAAIDGSLLESSAWVVVGFHRAVGGSGTHVQYGTAETMWMWEVDGAWLWPAIDTPCLYGSDLFVEPGRQLWEFELRRRLQQYGDQAA